MRNLYSFSMAIVLSVFFSSCKSEDKKGNINNITKTYFEDKNALNPLDATQNGQSQFNDQLAFEMTDSHRKKQAEFYSKYENLLTTVDSTSLSEEEKNSYDIMAWEIAVGKEMLQQNANLMPMHQFWGTHLTMGQYASAESAQPFKTEKDYQNFLKRMDAYTVWLDSAMVYMKKGIKEKVVIPRVLAEKIVPQFQDLLTPKVEDHLFYSSCKKFPADFSPMQKNKFAKAYATLITKKLNPQFEKFIAFMKSEYIPACRTTSGIGSIKGGNDLYKVCVKQWTTTNKTPEEIHEIGLKEV
ncbi:MAG: DUF885 domain-containing protein, partial [Flavobacterium sp.]